MKINEIIDIDKIKCRSFDPIITFQQLKNGDIRKYICWGVTKIVVYGNRECHALRFFVTGRKHRGHVYIALNGFDLYDIYYTTPKGKIVNKDTDIFCDDLTDIIDERIEKIAEYRY